MVNTECSCGKGYSERVSNWWPLYDHRALPRAGPVSGAPGGKACVFSTLTDSRQDIPTDGFIPLIPNLFWDTQIKRHGLWHPLFYVPEPALPISSAALNTIFWNYPFTGLTSSRDHGSLMTGALPFPSCTRCSAWYTWSTKKYLLNWTAVLYSVSHFRDFLECYHVASKYYLPVSQIQISDDN